MTTLCDTFPQNSDFSRHWLPVSQRVHFKILLLVFEALHGHLLVPYEALRDRFTLCAQNQDQAKPIHMAPELKIHFS